MRLTAKFLLFLLACCLPSMAQLADTTSIVGNVTDSGGAVVAGAKITAVNTATAEEYKSLTSAEGTYRIDFVKSGTYNVTAKREGFATISTTGVIVQSNQTVRTDFSLTIGQVNETIEVTATLPPISTDDASRKEVIAETAIAELPLNGRDVLQLAITTPGVMAGMKGTQGIPPGEGFIGAGTREIQNSISLDGISLVNNLITTAPFHPSADAVQEFQIQTGTYSAQYGAYLGVHLNLITKGGTNQLHGRAYEFFRNDALDARNYFLPASKKKAPLRQNQFGFEADGPVVLPKLYDGRNRTFFMGTYEGLRKTSLTTGIDSVLTDKMRQGNFSEISAALIDPLNSNAPFANNIIPSSHLSSQALKTLAYMPSANRTGTVNNFITNPPSNDNYNQTMERVDHNISDSARVFFRYAWQGEDLFSGSTNPYNGTTLPVNTRNWVGAYTQTLGSNMVNDLRFGKQSLGTDALNYWYTHNLTHAGADLGIPGFDGDTRFGNPGIPGFSISGFMGLGNTGSNWFQKDTTWHGSDSFTYVRGRHTLVAGVEARKLITDRRAVSAALGLINFDGSMTHYAASDLMLGLPISDTTPGPQVRNIVAEWRDGFYFVDNWQASKRLTLNLGLRYELATVPYSVNGNSLILNSTWTALLPATLPAPGMSLINPNHKDFAPRVGFAYRVTDKTVVRGGYGIYYNPNQMNSFTFLSNNPPLSTTTTYNASAGLPTLSLDNPTPSDAQAKAGLSNIVSPNANLPSAAMNQWSLDVQRSLWNGAALELGYLGSHTIHLDRSYYPNTPLPGAGSVASRRPNSNFASMRVIMNDEVASYNGFSATVRQRMNHGLTFLASYTWSHALDVSTDSNGGGAPMNPYNWRSDYGNSNWDVRHRFSGSFTYDLPFFKSSPSAMVRNTLGGWQTNGIVTLQTGMPFNVTIAGDVANTGVGNQRPNLVGTLSSNCGADHLSTCIDASAFAQPAAYTYGNAGRNLLFGPGSANVDFSLFKAFQIHERLRTQFRAEFFNFFNTPSFNNPSTTLNFNNTASLGNITSTKHDNRQIQLGLKLLF